MILGIGADLCSIDRIARSIERFGERFLDRIFTPVERARADALGAHRAASYAKRFAAKEAFAKALGSGLRDGIEWRDIGVVNDARGRPALALAGGAKAALDGLAPAGHAVDIHLSLTDDPPWAQAFVVLSARPFVERAGAGAAVDRKEEQ